MSDYQSLLQQRNSLGQFYINMPPLTLGHPPSWTVEISPKGGYGFFLE